MLRYLTAGESHGPQLSAILEGIPAGLPLTVDDVNRELARRQRGHGRGDRMRLEQDQAQICSGVRHGLTLGSPITLVIANRDWANWQDVMAIEPQADQDIPLTQPSPQREEGNRKVVTRPRPGHADLAGGQKYDQRDLRNILERSSARETAARVAVGAVCKRLLDEFQIKVFSHVIQIGQVRAKSPLTLPSPPWGEGWGEGDFIPQVEKSPVRCADPEASRRMVQDINQAQKIGDSLGGIIEIIALGAPAGLGSHVHWDRKLDGRLAGAVMSIQAIKGVEIGLGFEAARNLGSHVHDEILYEANQKIFRRKTNHAGGIEGGISNGEPIILRAAMKPIPTLRKPLSSVDILTKQPFQAAYERSDVCAVPAAGVVAEAAVAYELAGALCEKFGGDSLGEMRRNFAGYVEQAIRY